MSKFSKHYFVVFILGVLMDNSTAYSFHLFHTHYFFSPNTDCFFNVFNDSLESFFQIAAQKSVITSESVKITSGENFLDSTLRFIKNKFNIYPHKKNILAVPLIYECSIKSSHLK